ncbi:rho GTPase-activating protein 190 isoform X1 [Galleria mellonella]|uniref:Rho GTPase-activating protein 190 isoform X1 n=1 Tax=Galleria mellonella TaxID=7137 RepID=A0A6J1WW14_GALME|nr:rho GTPase-activating protein 190 isoform X1 [Galleria mellonella]XP_031765450.1 rho GTPase-activating protein 190 isoform X1 [Galleria mellonella]XP_031765451.1 rho GTPase-activating protein 190 isoform X1 [Galleria mellonella]
MAKKSDNTGGKLVTVSVVGLSGTEKEKGQLGIGKSCLCNRFVRTHADDYNVDHISVLSQSDFSGRVVNNDHFLYWGSVQKENDEQEYRFEIIEQTEFVDDACFQPFKVGKTETYVKRCVATKIQSAEKLMYVCKNQLGIEKEYEQRLMPDGKLSVDGFLCVYDVSMVPGRTWEKQNETLAAILQNILKLKKPVVLVTSKNDEACEQGIREAERLVQRKEFKGAIPIVETSSHDNVNVDQAFFLLAQMVDKSKARIKVANYAEALRIRRETLDFVTEAFTQLIRIHVQDHKEMWSAASKRLCHYPEWVKFVQQFGNDGTQVVFRRHIRRLKEERSAKKLRKQLAKLPQVLSRMQLPTEELQENDWPMVVRQLRAHRDFSVYFSEGRPQDSGSESGSELDSPLGTDTTLRVGERAIRYQTLGQSQKIPYEILESNEAAAVFKTYLHEAQEEQRNYEWCQQFKRLLEETGYVTPGKQLSEVRVLLMGRECYEALTEEQQQRVYDQHQRQIQRRAKHNLQELLLEHADLFYHFKSISPTGTITQEDIKEITDVLQDDFRYKMLDRMEQDRKLMLFQHLGFVHCPMREHCPAGARCLDAALPLILNTRVGSLTSTGESQCHAGPPAAPWALTTDSNQINVIILGVEGTAGEFGKRLLAGCDGERRVMVGGQAWRVEQRLRTDDFSDSTPIDDFAPNGYFCVYQDQESFEYIRGCTEKTLLTSLEQEDKQPFQGLPLVVMFVQDEGMDKKEITRLQEEGQNLADNLHCSYMEASVNELGTEALTSDAIQELIRANREKASYAHLYKDLIVCFDSDIRIMVCMFCDDPYSPERVLSPLLSHRACFLTGDRSIVIETFLGDSKRKVEVIISSFHGASQFREELIHGFILIYSAKRKASLATLNAFSMNIPNLPIQMVAVTDGGGSAANAFFGTDVGHALITEGNATADRLGAHFTTYTSTAESKSAFYTPFFKEVWERKGEIERAFRLEAPHNLPDVAAARPAPPPRNHSYHLNHKMEHKLTNSLDLLIGPDSRADIDSEYSDTMNNKNRGFLKGFSVYPPPSTPPEPAPPDHRMHADLSPDLNCSEDSLSTHESDGGGLWQPSSYGHRAFTMGPTKPHPPPPRVRHSQTLKQPGKLDMNNYTMVSDALQHITIGPPHSRDRKSQRSGWSHSSSQQGGHHHHPSGVSSETELDAQYAQIKETNEYMEAPSMMRLRRHRRHEKTPLHQPSLSETDSSGSSEASGGPRVQPRRRHNPHHAPRHYKKRSLGNLVAVQSPRVPKLGMFVGPPELPTGYRARTQEDKAGSESSEGSSDGETRRPRPLPPPPHHEPTLKMVGGTGAGAPVPGDYSPSTQDNSSSSAADSRRRHHPFSKHDRRHKEFSKSKDSKKNSSQITTAPTVQNWGPQGSHGVPLFVEKCVEFIEREGLASEGLYRVPGNRAHVEMLFTKFYEDPNIDLESLDIPVNAVATALKDFFSKKLPPLLDEESMARLEDIAAMRGCMAGGVELKDRSWRLLALRSLLNSALTAVARATLDYLLHHFARVADNSKLNSMDSKNLAICWWPTLLPVQFSDMGRFEMTRPYLEDIVQTMIDQHPFLFRGQEAFVMV